MGHTETAQDRYPQVEDNKSRFTDVCQTFARGVSQRSRSISSEDIEGEDIAAWQVDVI